jgi:nitrate reductase gamma subunit
MVYLAFGVLIVGTFFTIFRIFKAPKQPFTLQIFPHENPAKLRAFYDTFLMPAIRTDRPVFWFFLILYHIAFLLLILGHLDLIPGINIMDPESRHMVGNGGAGVALTLSVIYFIGRRLKSPVREVSTFGDYLLLLLLLFIFLTGDMMSWSNSWNENGFVLEKGDFANYLKILVSFSFQNPYEVLESSHYIHVVIHVFLANLFLMIFPFTKFVHTFFSMAVNTIRRGK